MNSKILIILITVMMVSFACEPPTEPVKVYETSAELMGIDGALCACCGGIIAKIENSELDYRIMNYGTAFQNMIDTIEFPITISMDFTDDGPCTSYQFITVDDFELE